MSNDSGVGDTQPSAAPTTSEPGVSLAAERCDASGLLDALPEACFAIDPDGQVTYANLAAEKLLGQLTGGSPGSLLGRNIWQDCPDVADSAFARVCQEALTEKRAVESQAYYPAFNRWFAVRVCPAGDRLCVFLRDVTERARLERELRRAEAQAEPDEGTCTFLPRLAHEVRNVLAPVHNALYLAGLRDLDPDGQRASALAQQAVRRLSVLMDDLLMGSHPPTVANKEWINLTAFLAQTLSEALQSGVTAGRNLTVQSPPGPLWVEADPKQLEHILDHLLANAVQGTCPGGLIQVTAQQVGTDVVLRVCDDGVLPVEEIPHSAFNPFKPQEGVPDRLQWGWRVGLWLVRRLVELHGGSVDARERGATQGREFTVCLPRGQKPPVTTAPENDSESGQPVQVLVVDDKVDVAQTLLILLRTWGCEVRVAYDGEKALQEIRDRRPDLVLVDILLPGMNGYEVAERIRLEEKEKGHRLPLAAVTGCARDEDRARAREAGFDYHMVKPVNPENLKDLVQYIRSGA
jgi:PAS domain S-box-containing protein